MPVAHTSGDTQGCPITRCGPTVPCHVHEGFAFPERPEGDAHPVSRDRVPNPRFHGTITPEYRFILCRPCELMVLQNVIEGFGRQVSRPHAS